MRILAVDTSASACSVALAEDGLLTCEYTADHGRTHAVRLSGMIDAVFADAGIRARDVDAFAVTAGPGSFTGLRIGISTVKGLAFAASRPVISVSTLDVLANQCPGVEMPICPFIDARKKEVYAALYRQRRHGGFETLVPPAASRPADFLSEIGRAGFGAETGMYFLGSGTALYADLIARQFGDSAVLAPRECSLIRASTLARMAFERYHESGGITPHALVPCYIRRSDAEKKGSTAASSC